MQPPLGQMVALGGLAAEHDHAQLVAAVPVRSIRLTFSGYSSARFMVRQAAVLDPDDISWVSRWAR
jgi:hypothetical protein